VAGLVHRDDIISMRIVPGVVALDHMPVPLSQLEVAVRRQDGWLRLVAVEPEQLVTRMRL
jgi:hypothetical protein